MILTAKTKTPPIGYIAIKDTLQVLQAIIVDNVESTKQLNLLPAMNSFL